MLATQDGSVIMFLPTGTDCCRYDREPSAPPRRGPKARTERAVRQLRGRLNLSQAVFARWLNVSTKLVQAWEAGRRAPDGPALLLLRLVERSPADFVRGLYGPRVAEPRSPFLYEFRRPKRGHLMRTHV